MMTSDQEWPVKVHLVQDDTRQPITNKTKDRVSTTNSYPLTIGANPVQIMSHSPYRKRATIVVNASGSDVIAFGGSQSDVESALQSPSQFLGNVAYVVGPYAATIELENTDEIWSALLSNAVSNPSPSQPAVPATGVAQQNVNAYPVQVVISPNGATITNVSVNGVTVGTAAGTYTVPAYGAISIAYSVATPTWAWTNANAVNIAGNIVVSVFKETENC